MACDMDAIRASYRILQAISVHARALASDVGPDPPLSGLGDAAGPRGIEASQAGSQTERDPPREGSDELARRQAARELWARDMTALAARAAAPTENDAPPTFTFRIGPDGRPYAIGDPTQRCADDRRATPEIRGPTEGEALAMCDTETPPRADVMRHAYASAATEEVEPSTAIDVVV